MFWTDFEKISPQVYQNWLPLRPFGTAQNRRLFCCAAIVIPHRGWWRAFSWPRWKKKFTRQNNRSRGMFCKHEGRKIELRSLLNTRKEIGCVDIFRCPEPNHFYHQSLRDYRFGYQGKWNTIKNKKHALLWVILSRACAEEIPKERSKRDLVSSCSQILLNIKRQTSYLFLPFFCPHQTQRRTDKPVRPWPFPFGTVKTFYPVCKRQLLSGQPIQQTIASATMFVIHINSFRRLRPSSDRHVFVAKTQKFKK